MTLKLIIALILFACGAVAQERPDLKITPGVVVLHRAEEVCSVKWGKDVRHVTLKMKREVCAAYGAKNCPGKDWEIDHLISRELGGADDVRNLWPEPYVPTPGAHQKDQVENWLHRQVCSGQMTLDEAQREIRADWFAVYERMERAR